MRGFLVALMIMTPALILPNVRADSSQITVLVALLAAFLVFVEYNSNFPSIVEFRDASPMNRLRFCFAFAAVFILAAICKGKTDPTLLTNALASIGTLVGRAMDFPFSPVRLMVLMLPESAPFDVVRSVRTAAGVSYGLAVTSVLIFVFMVRVLGWPFARNGPFNVWINLPLFDPTAGGDALVRMQRDARINIILGFLLPFIIPAVVKLGADLIAPVTLDNPQTLIWTMTAWAFLPASLVMRGVAMAKVADMIQEKRKRTYASADDAEYQTA